MQEHFRGHDEDEARDEHARQERERQQEQFSAICAEALAAHPDDLDAAQRAAFLRIVSIKGMLVLGGIVYRWCKMAIRTELRRLLALERANARRAAHAGQYNSSPHYSGPDWKRLAEASTRAGKEQLLNTMLGHVGKRLRDSTAEEIDTHLKAEQIGLTTNLGTHIWLKAIIAQMPAGKRTGDVLTEEELQAMRREADEQAKQTVEAA